MTEDLQERIDGLNSQVTQLTANNTLHIEKIDKLEKDLQRLAITGSQLVAAQKLRTDSTKTKADIAAAVGVDHQVLASVLGGLDTILNEATKGTYTEAQHQELKANSDLAIDALQSRCEDLEAQLSEAKKDADAAFQEGRGVQLGDGVQPGDTLLKAES